MKQRIKNFIRKKLHFVDRQQYEILEAVISNGVTEYLGFDYNNFRQKVLEYMGKMQVAPYEYKYSRSCNAPCLYASIYAVMLEGLLGVLNDRNSDDLKGWAEYFNQFQKEEDGIFYDPRLMGPSYEHIGCWNEGWGKYHLMGHIIIAFARLGFTPKYQLRYLEKYYNSDYLLKWMSQFDFSNDVWTKSNYFMNLYTVMEYARDYMSEQQADVSIKLMSEWLLKRQNPETGMWHTRPFGTLSLSEKLNVVRAAYHFYPLFEYENIQIPYADKIVETILPLQNSWGGWTIEGGNSGACEDIDAIDPLLRYSKATPSLQEEICLVVKKSMIWQLASKNRDNGFSFYVRAQQNYGNHPLTTSLRDESSMFATWFRTLCIAYEAQYLQISNEFEVGRFPGYEIPIYTDKNG